MANGARATANIILSGFMGTGKSTVGRIIADRLGLPFVDTDAEVERRHGKIATIFSDFGEDRFRHLEQELVTELTERPGPMVIATGGGMLVNPANAARLSATGAIYVLTATPDEIVRRVVDGSGDRPLLSGPDPAGTVAELLGDRSPVYSRWTAVSTDGCSPEAVADLVLEDATERGVVHLLG